MPASRSLRKRLTWYVVVTLLTLTTLSGILVYQGTREEADEVFSASLVQTARILDGLITRETLDQNRLQLMRALQAGQRKHEYERKLFFAVLDAGGEMLLHSRKAPQLPLKGLQAGFSQFRHDGRKWFTFALESSRDDLLIVVGERGEVRDEITEYVGSGLLTPLLLMLPGVLWLLWKIVGVALQPLAAVADQVRRQDLQRLTPVDDTGVPLEIRPLVDALNQMIRDLDAAYTRERRFVSDASHELRNPLASLLINVDNALEESEDEEVRDTLKQMKNSILRLTHLVSQLLALSHLESASADAAREPVDLVELCAAVIESKRPRALQKSISIELQRSRPCEVNGDRVLLDSLVTNLVDNAVRYCNAGDRVRLGCQWIDGQMRLRVEDSGPGLDAEQRREATARFYRGSAATGGGAGLGLSIVETIAASHGGRIELGESELGGLCVTVFLGNDRTAG